MIPMETTHDMAGHYTLRVRSAGDLICDLPIVVVWVEHPSQAEPFLGFRPDDPSELRTALAAYAGQPVELDFVPR
jgi:hypothetical protein